VIRELYLCTECRQPWMVARSHKRKMGHIKTMYCGRCKGTRRFRRVK